MVTKFRGFFGYRGWWLLRFFWYTQQPVVQGCVSWGVCGCMRIAWVVELCVCNEIRKGFVEIVVLWGCGGL